MLTKQLNKEYLHFYNNEKNYVDFYRNEYEEFIGVSTLNTNLQIYTLEEQIMRYAKHLSFWYMKIDQLKQTQPADTKQKETFLTLEIQRTINSISKIIPTEIVGKKMIWQLLQGTYIKVY